MAKSKKTKKPPAISAVDAKIAARDIARYTAGEGRKIGRLTAREANPGWQPKEIVYYRLVLDPSPDGVFKFDFAKSFKVKGVGVPGGVALKDVLKAIQRDNTDNLNKTPLDQAKEIAPDLRVIKSCYVVVQLAADNADWHFSPGTEAVQTLYDHYTDYLELRHVRVGDLNIDNPEFTAPGDPRTDPGADKCRLIYFAAPKPVEGGPGFWRKDVFTLYTQTGGRVFTPHNIDPDIKNNGGDNDLYDLTAGRSGAKKRRTKA